MDLHRVSAGKNKSDLNAPPAPTDSAIPFPKTVSACYRPAYRVSNESIDRVVRKMTSMGLSGQW